MARATAFLCAAQQHLRVEPRTAILDEPVDQEVAGSGRHLPRTAAGLQSRDALLHVVRVAKIGRVTARHEAPGIRQPKLSNIEIEIIERIA